MWLFFEILILAQPILRKYLSFFLPKSTALIFALITFFLNGAILGAIFLFSYELDFLGWVSLSVFFKLGSAGR